MIFDIIAAVIGLVILAVLGELNVMLLRGAFEENEWLGSAVLLISVVGWIGLAAVFL